MNTFMKWFDLATYALLAILAASAILNGDWLLLLIAIALLIWQRLIKRYEQRMRELAEERDKLAAALLYSAQHVVIVKETREGE